MSTHWGAVVPPVFVTAGFDETGAPPSEGSFTYSRYGNPTVDRLERALAELEGAEAGAAFSSGMGAIHAVLAALLGKGAAVVVSDHVYPPTEVLVRRLERGGWLTARFVDPDDVDAVRVALQGARLLWLEAPSNPGLHVPAAPMLAQVAHDAGALVALDATIATPVHWQPLRHGADLVVHSLTKYVSGSGDVLGGAVLGPAALVAEVRAVAAGTMGNVLGALDAFLLARGLESMPVRVRAQSVAAARLAGWLTERLGGQRVWYPSHPDGGRDGSVRPFGGMVLFRADDPDRFERRLGDSTVLRRAPSFGDSRSLVSCLRPDRFPPASRAALQRRCGTLPGLIRLSVGLEEEAALERELARLLDRQ